MKDRIGANVKEAFNSLLKIMQSRAAGEVSAETEKEFVRVYVELAKRHLDILKTMEWSDGLEEAYRHLDSAVHSMQSEGWFK